MTLQLSLRGEASDACHKALKTLSGCAFMKLQGVRWRPERIQKTPLANLNLWCVATGVGGSIKLHGHASRPRSVDCGGGA